MADVLGLNVVYNENNGNINLKKELVYRPLIAHAGGQVNNINGTNSKEGIINSVIQGKNLVEIDFGFTTDGKLVAIHDFEDGMSKYFKTNYRPITHEEFMGLDMVGGLTQLDIDDIIYLLDVYPSLHIITDTKYDNIEMLNYLATNYPDYIDRFIPQIYAFNEYDKVKRQGFDNIIFTTYKSYIDNRTLLKFAKNNELFAITMPYERALNGLAKGIYEETGIPVYAHTVNDIGTYNKLMDLGVYGVYTDTLNFIDIE